MRVTRSQAVSAMQNDIMANGYNISQTVKIDETPDCIRHACAYKGVTFLQRQSYGVPTEDMGVIDLPWYFCEQCGKLYVYNSLYD